MKIYLETSVNGDGYTRKGYDWADRDGNSEELDSAGKALYMCSKARLLLAYLEGKRFGFVREVEAQPRDEQKRRKHINLLLVGDVEEVDPVLCMAAERYPVFAGALRASVAWEEGGFSLDRDAFAALLAAARNVPADADRQKPVAMVAPDPSLRYFLKMSGMGWQEGDIARVVDPDLLREDPATENRIVGEPFGEAAAIPPKGPAESAGEEAAHEAPSAQVPKPYEDMKVCFYCPSPSIGWTIKQVDPTTGEVKSEGQRARANLSRKSVTMLDNYGGCSMALFQSGVRQCFLVKQVKSDTVNQYGQNKTVTLIVESAKSQSAVRQLAALAVLDYPTFKQRLLDCVKITASTAGFIVYGDKLRALLEPVRTRVRPAEGDPRGVEWEKIVAPPTPSKPYSFLMLETSLDYFNNSTGLGVGREQIRKIYNDSVIQGNRQAMQLVADERVATPTLGEKTPGDDTPGDDTRGDDTPGGDTRGDDTPGDDTPGDDTLVSTINTPSSNVSVGSRPVSTEPDSIHSKPEELPKAKDVDRIDLLDYPAFKVIAICVLVGILTIVGLLIARHRGKDAASVKASAPAAGVEVQKMVDEEQPEAPTDTEQSEDAE